LTARSDEQLFEAFCAGEGEAFAELVRRYERPLYSFLAKFLGQGALAEDVFQETFLQVHVSAKSFEAGRRFRPWLYAIAANKARDALRRQSRQPTVQLTGGEDDLDVGGLWDGLLRETQTPPEVLEKKQEEALVRRVVGALPEGMREILVLAYFKHLSYKELADHLGIPLGTVKSRLHGAVGRFVRDYRELAGERERKEDG